MNWYKKTKCAQVWEVDSDESFAEELKAFYELEYKYQCLKNFPFEGMDRRYQNIFSNVEESLMYIMNELRGTLLSTFKGWLDTHAITDPATWAAKRADPYGEGDMSSYDAQDVLEGIIGEYIRYKNGGQFGGYNAYNRPNTSQVLSEMLDQALAMSEQFTSLQGVQNVIEAMDRERLEEELYHDEFENFGINQRGEAFQSEEEAQAYIEEIVSGVDIQEYVSNFGKEELLSLLEGQGQMENFLVELNQHIVFPLWYQYWSSMGIDTTRELAEEAYEGLNNANTIDEFHLALEVAIQTCHQNGSMLEYLEEYGGEEYGADPQEIEDIMKELTEGKGSADWDKQLKDIGVKIPTRVMNDNLERAKASKTFLNWYKRAQSYNTVEQSLEWLNRHEIAMENGKYILYHGTPKNNNLTELRSGSLMAEDENDARFFAARDRDLRPQDIIVYKVLVGPEDINTGVFASLNKSYKL